MRVVVDRRRCAGHALCFATAADLFPLDDEGFAIADEREASPEMEQRAVLAARRCPEHAIGLKA